MQSRTCLVQLTPFCSVVLTWRKLSLGEREANCCSMGIVAMCWWMVNENSQIIVTGQFTLLFAPLWCELQISCKTPMILFSSLQNTFLTSTGNLVWSCSWCGVSIMSTYLTLKGADITALFFSEEKDIKLLCTVVLILYFLSLLSSSSVALEVWLHLTPSGYAEQPKAQ